MCAWNMHELWICILCRANSHWKGQRQSIVTPFRCFKSAQYALMKILCFIRWKFSLTAQFTFHVLHIELCHKHHLAMAISTEINKPTFLRYLAIFLQWHTYHIYNFNDKWLSCSLRDNNNTSARMNSLQGHSHSFLSLSRTWKEKIFFLISCRYYKVSRKSFRITALQRRSLSYSFSVMV